MEIPTHGLHGSVRHFEFVGSVDVGPLRLALAQHPELWNKNRDRLEFAESPHSQVDDIWCRYKEDTSRFVEDNKLPHDSVWYPAAKILPVKPIVYSLMNQVHGDRLGGVLITRIEPHRAIAEHADTGWHVEYYQKYYVSIEACPGAEFLCMGESLCPRVGDVWWFDNRKPHSVKNEGKGNRTTMIVCIKHE